MAEHSRYNVGGSESARVLKNKLNIKDQKMLEDVETILFADSYKYFFEILGEGRVVFNTDLIFKIHHYSLKHLYLWAGRIRIVEISKNNILFCASSQIKKSLLAFEKILKQNLPSEHDDKNIASRKLSIIHCEFNAIHPFREGNGRTIRLFLDLLAASAGFNPIDFSKSSQEAYIKGCIAGMRKDYSKMQKIIQKGLFKS